MEEENIIEEEAVVAVAGEEDELFDYNEGLITTIANKVKCESLIRKMYKANPILKESLIEKFVFKIREEQYTSKSSNIADLLAFRAYATIETESRALAFWFININPQLNTVLETDTMELMRVLTEAPGRAKGSKASASTCLQRLKALLFCIELFRKYIYMRNVPLLAKINELKTNAEAFDVMASASQKTSRDAQELPRTFTEVVNKVKDHFGQNSKEYILFELYAQLPVRDNLNLEIVDQAHVDNQSKSNLLILKPTGPIRVVILDHKTRNLYGDLGQVLSLSLSNIIRNYILANHLELHDLLFGPKVKLSSLVQQTFTAVGNPGLGINSIRRIFANTNSTLPPLEAAKLARLSGHSLQTEISNYRTKQAEKEIGQVQEQLVEQNFEQNDRIIELNTKIDNLRNSIEQIKDKLHIN